VRHFGRGLVKAVGKALDQPTKGVVIDLRSSASGDEIEMRKLADMLIGGGSIGSRQTRLDLGNRKWKAKKGSVGERADLPVVVAVDGNTSGLAEVLAAAFAAHDRGLLVGRTTAGEDTLETMRLFRDGSAIQITSTRLLGPDRAALSGGVKPHLDVPAAGAVMLATAVIDRAQGPSLGELEALGREVSK
jgi:C-terminal processing protease CtpA/Prc